MLFIVENQIEIFPVAIINRQKQNYGLKQY